MHQTRRSRQTDFVILLSIAAFGLLLRWWRLDLISFRFDTAEALFRAREMIRHGSQPFMGIVNSLGFRNPPGLIWAIVPPLAISPSPMIATAWFALLCLSGLWPLYRMASRWIGPWGFLIPCVLFVAMPSGVNSSRTIWAQCLLPAMGCWTLHCLLMAWERERPIAARVSSGLTAIVIAIAAASVHPASALYAAVTAVLALAGLRKELPAAARALVSARKPAVLAVFCVVLLLTLLPSAYDWLQRRDLPQADKPDYIEKFESRMVEADPIMIRFRHALADQLDIFQSAPLTVGFDDEPEFSNSVRRQLAVAPVDMAIMLAAICGLGMLSLRLVRVARGRQAVAGSQCGSGRDEMTLAVALVVWYFAAPAVGSMLASRINATYFAMGSPALLLTAGIAVYAVAGRLFRKRGTLALVIMSGGIAGLYGWFQFSLTADIDRARFLNSQYYIPLANQDKLAEGLARSGVSARRFKHLSGDWYQRPYDYLLTEMHDTQAPIGQERWASAEDLNLRRTQPERTQIFEARAEQWEGKVGIILFADPSDWKAFTSAYYELLTSADTETTAAVH